ncbi:MAG: hypothetical protein F4W95_07820 [Chloroflexi bacterium]|nr:hypothetical protein [Chloroflexota bacterium]MYD48378.1 hypothetical protein [Chloroflexota bacterium]
MRQNRLLPIGVSVALAALLWIAAACGSETPLPAEPSAAPGATRAGDSTPTGEPTPAAAGIISLGATTVASERMVRPGIGTRAERLPVPMTAANFPTPPERDLLLLARQLRRTDAPPPATTAATDWQVGDTRDFWTLNYPRLQMERNRFNLAAVSDNAYWWIAEGLSVEDDDLQRTVREAEERVFPQVLAVFGTTPEPGATLHRRHVVSGRIPGIGGYVSGGDLYPAAVSPYSNEADVIYINSRAADYGDRGFLHILTHELQHSIHQQADESEATWLNEGLAELAVKEAGYRVFSIEQYLRRPDASLVNWPDELGSDVGLNYGAAALFAHYLREHYAPEGGLQDLLALDADGIRAVDAFLDGRGAVADDGSPADFHTVFADWVAANLLDWNSTRYGYDGLEVEADITRRQSPDDDSSTAQLAQYAIDYVELVNANGPMMVHFEGAAATPLLPVDVPGECWWSNRGDSISATLTLPLTVPAAPDGSEPMLTYRYWHHIEENWDYLYLTASTDGGATWDVLPADGTTDANPVGNSYGDGYTGTSDGWQDGAASLAAYAGQDILLRFHYVTDDAIHGTGFCLRETRLSWHDAALKLDEWQPDGFVLVNNLVRQDWIVWVIIDAPPDAGGSATRLELAWDAQCRCYAGSTTAPDTSVGRLVVAVSPTAPATMEPAEYRVWTRPGR